MCAHKVVGMSIIGLTCASVVAGTLVKIGPNTEVISTRADKSLAFGCDPRIVHNYKPLSFADEERQRALIVGKWVGEADGDGSKRRFLTENFADGTFRVTYRTPGPGGREKIEQHVGQWGISGPIFFTTVTGIAEEDSVAETKPGDPYNYGAFEVFEIGDKYFEYESFSPRARYVAHRVSDDFDPNDL